MLTQVAVIDEAGRLTLPKPALEALGVPPRAEVVIEVTESGVVLRPKAHTPITERISAMNLPVADWKQMENETEAGRL